MLANVKVSCLYKQRRLQANKIAYIIYYSLDTINELDCLKAKEAKAEWKQIAEQSAEVTYRSLTKEISSIVAQEAWLYSKGDISVFNQSSIVNNSSINLSKFLGMFNLSRSIISNENISTNRPSSQQ